MLYDVTLRISYTYDNAADASRQILRLMPMEEANGQRLVVGLQVADPQPEEWIDRVDFFGNRCIEIAYRQAHHDVTFTMRARVERLAQPAKSDTTLPLSALAGELEAHQLLSPWAPHHFLGPSPRVPQDAATAAYARDQIVGDPDVLGLVIAIGLALHRDMEFDAEATTVETPMAEAFAGRRGVCQDFSHVMIACLRGLGIPAGYVSGFLRTIPPPGKPRLEGADAMHAWVCAWCGEKSGWFEYDPTNAMPAGHDHIMVARGRDYSDVAPIKGIMRTFGKHTTEQSVDVIPLQTSAA